MANKDKRAMDMPEVRDIPGQEHVRPPQLGEMADNTPSSSDEEGEEVLKPLDRADEDDLEIGGPSDVSAEERRLLATADGDQGDDTKLKTGLLDSTDSDGTPLNEKSFGEGNNDDVSGDDLDVPGSGQDDQDEALGEEDEENNDYSISDNNDDTDINLDQ